jgi:hypothetical protein
VYRKILQFQALYEVEFGYDLAATQSGGTELPPLSAAGGVARKSGA